MNMQKQVMQLAILGLLSVSVGAVAGGVSVFTGYDTNEDAETFYVGGVAALNGDLNSGGILIRSVASVTEYEYETEAFSRDVDGDLNRFELGAGYQWVMEKAQVSLYGGADYQDHDLSPDDRLNESRGYELGGSAQIEAASRNTDYDLNLIAAYSTANDSYWSRVRGGYNFGPVTTGLELLAAGSESYDEERYGVYAMVPITDNISFNISVGESESEGDDSREDSDGTYSQIGFGFSF